ncbi:MAG TPA: glucan biosynthesis protein D [Steroidobacteraceae bacterium]|jgi:glucans biosynthesis protein|nr:glucan biosynthesis protein D [Steroidobacteraceae bacterium]
MYRRRFLQSGAALVAAASAPRWSAAQAAQAAPAKGPPPPKRLGAPEPFDYASLKGLAHSLAAAAYRQPSAVLPPQIAALSWDQWQAIQFRDQRSLWAGEGLRFQARFFHLGFTIRKPVRLYTVENGMAQELAFDPALFDYSRSGIDARKLPAHLGFAGFRLLFHTDWHRDFAAFQGASYFRAVDGDMQYGMSQRGLAIDTGMARPEEFPDFIAYYLERPAADVSTVTVYGLLDSPSTTGAYRFVISVADSVVMDIDAALYPRKVIERIGIAPGTSMFYYDQSQHRLSQDWRPAIHDSDGLQLYTGAGEWLWRPLVNPPALRVNSYLDDGPRGFGLMQRDRNFADYQDDGVFYDRRPSVWVQPKGDWGRGAVMLVEIPAADETFDNIVAFWNPADKPQPGQELRFAYRLYWCRYNPVVCRLAQVQATRDGIGGIVGQPRRYFSWRFVVDFVGGDFALMGANAPVESIVSATRGQIELVSARPLAPTGGWRAMFDLRLTDDSVEPINLRLFLSLDGQPLSETWIYQYTPPPPVQRRL